MTDVLLAQLRSVNPAPNATLLDFDDAALLAAIDDVAETMTAAAERSATRGLPRIDDPRGRSWKKPLIAAAAAFVTVLVGVGLSALLLADRGPLRPASTPPPVSTTISPSTTQDVSPDGATLFPLRSVLYGVASNGSVLVAVGTDDGFCCGTGVDGSAKFTGSAAVWTSSDGMVWTRVPHDEAIFGGVDGQIMRRVVSTPFGFVAAGEDRAGAFDEPGRPAFWLSVDGADWSRVPEGGITGAGHEGIYELLVWGDTLYAFGWNYTLTSGDGVTWEQEPVLWVGETVAGGGRGEFEAVALPDGIHRSPVHSVVQTPDGYIALGSRPDSLSTGLYRSLDGVAWTPDPTYGPSVAPGKIIYGMTEFKGEIIGVGVGPNGAVAEPVLTNPPDLTPPPSDAGLIGPGNWSLILVDTEGRGDVELVADELRTEADVVDVMVVPSTWDSWYAATGTDTTCLVNFSCGQGVVVLFGDEADVAALEQLYAARFGFTSASND